MGLGAVLAGVQLVGSAASAIQGNQNRQKAKGQIDKAFRLGRERLATRQQDQRRTQAESLISRGLTQGGIRLRTRPVADSRGGAESVTGARTLGEQQQLDLTREQQVEQDALRQQRNAARAGVNAEYTQGLVGAIGSGVAGAVNAFAVDRMRPRDEAPAGAPSSVGEFGIDPIAPWEPVRTDTFNVWFDGSRR